MADEKITALQVEISRLAARRADVMDNLIPEHVKAPEHYANRKYQTILVIEDSLSLEEMKGYCKGNILKYVSRAGKKDKTVQDLKKAETYLKWLIQLEEEGKLTDVPTYNERKD